VVRAVGEGEEPGGTVPIESGGGEAAAASGIFQESQGEVVQEPAQPVEATVPRAEAKQPWEMGESAIPSDRFTHRKLSDALEQTINGDEAIRKSIEADISRIKGLIEKSDDKIRNAVKKGNTKIAENESKGTGKSLRKELNQLYKNQNNNNRQKLIALELPDGSWSLRNISGEQVASESSFGSPLGAVFKSKSDAYDFAARYNTVIFAEANVNDLAKPPVAETATTAKAGVKPEAKEVESAVPKEAQGEVKSAQETEKANVVNYPINRINTDVDRFQNRLTEFSEKTAATIAERYDPNKFDAIVLWRDPTEGKTYVVSGHSRLEGMKRRGADKVPAKFFEGSEKEAVEFARIEANRLATGETITETVNAYKSAKKANYTKAKLRDLFDGDVEFLDAIQHLNSKGEWLRYLGNPAAGEFPYLKRFSRWVGELRGRYPDKLTDAHETQLFDFVYREAKKNVDISKDDFFRLVEKQIDQFLFNPEEALVLKRTEVVTGTRARADTAVWQAELDELKELRDKSKTKEEYNALTIEIERLQRGISDVIDSQTDMFKANGTRERLADDAGFLRLGQEQKRNPFKEMDKHIKHLSREIAKSEMSELRRKQQTKNTKSIPSNREPEPGLNTPPPASLEPDAETLFQSIVRTVQDKLNRLDYYQKKIETITGQPVSEESDVALRARLYIGRASEHIRKFDKVMIENKDSFLARLTKDKLSVDDIGIYLYAKHTKERNAYIASINPAFKPGEGGSGLTDVEAAAILESYKETPVEKYAEEFYNKVTRPALKMRLDAGLITREEYDALNKRWQYYVPLKGKAGIESYLRTGKGFSIGGKEFKLAAGRRSMADNPFVQAMADYNEAVVRSEKNKVARTLKKLIEENPAPDLWAINEVESRPYIDKEGNIQYRDVMVKWADNVVECKENGRTFAITLKDKAMASGMKNLGLGRGIPFLINVNNYLRAINTIVNPKFMVTNFERDIQTALIHVTGEQSTKMSVQTLKYLPDAMRGIWKDVRDKTSNEWSELYADLKERGGKVGWMDVKSVEEEMQRFEKQVAQFKSKGSPRRIMESTLNLISSANEVVESGVRLAFYKTAIENGISRDRAAMAAKNLTVNFNDKGTIGQVMNSLWLFSSAGVNGMARVFKAMGVPFNPKTRGQRRVQTICAGLTMTGFVQAYFNRLTNPDDWDKMSDYNKDNYWLQMLPNGKSIAFKAPYGYNVFLALGRIAEEAVFGNLTLGRAGSRTFQAFNNAFNPLGGGSFIQFIVPTITDPFVQLAENKNFFGGAIAPEQPPFGQPRKPRSQLYFKNVRQTSRIFTDWLNRITGGSEEKSGVIDVSPEWVDHFIDWGTGGLGRFIGEGVETGYTLLAEGSFPDLYNTPVANLFVKASSEYSDVQKISEIYLESKRKTISVDQRKRFYELVNRAVEDGTIEAEDGDKKIEAFKRNQGLPTGKPLSKKPSKLRGKKK
jgi:hypothetical protein